jgi:hypothetical protein
VRIHYSEQLGRNYEDDDMLERNEVAAILSINAGREIPPAYVNTLAGKGSLPFERQPQARKLLFKYTNVRNYIVSQRTGRKPGATPSPNAERQRKYKARRRLAGPIGDDQGVHWREPE